MPLAAAGTAVSPTIACACISAGRSANEVTHYKVSVLRAYLVARRLPPRKSCVPPKRTLHRKSQSQPEDAALDVVNAGVGGQCVERFSTARRHRDRIGIQDILDIQKELC